MKRIIIVGTTGSGKSTLAKALASKLAYPHIQLDALFWKPNWGETDDQELFKKLEEETSAPTWVLDGNYGRTHHISWPKADTVVWIDYPFWLTFYQNFTRSFKRSLTKEELWGVRGNTESFSRMFSKDSILLWLIKTYKSNVKRYEKVLENPEFSHIKFYRLKSRQEFRLFMESL